MTIAAISALLVVALASAIPSLHRARGSDAAESSAEIGDGLFKSWTMSCGNSWPPAAVKIFSDAPLKLGGSSAESFESMDETSARNSWGTVTSPNEVVVKAGLIGRAVASIKQKYPLTADQVSAPTECAALNAAGLTIEVQKREQAPSYYVVPFSAANTVYLLNSKTKDGILKDEQFKGKLSKLIHDADIGAATCILLKMSSTADERPLWALRSWYIAVCTISPNFQRGASQLNFLSNAQVMQQGCAIDFARYQALNDRFRSYAAVMGSYRLRKPDCAATLDAWCPAALPASSSSDATGFSLEMSTPPDLRPCDSRRAAPLQNAREQSSLPSSALQSGQLRGASSSERMGITPTNAEAVAVTSTTVGMEFEWGTTLNGVGQSATALKNCNIFIMDTKARALGNQPVLRVTKDMGGISGDTGRATTTASYTLELITGPMELGENKANTMEAIRASVDAFFFALWTVKKELALRGESRVEEKCPLKAVHDALLKSAPGAWTPMVRQYATIANDVFFAAKHVSTSASPQLNVLLALDAFSFPRAPQPYTFADQWLMAQNGWSNNGEQVMLNLPNVLAALPAGGDYSANAQVRGTVSIVSIMINGWLRCATHQPMGSLFTAQLVSEAAAGPIDITAACPSMDVPYKNSFGLMAKLEPNDLFDPALGIPAALSWSKWSAANLARLADAIGSNMIHVKVKEKLAELGCTGANQAALILKFALAFLKHCTSRPGATKLLMAPKLLPPSKLNNRLALVFELRSPVDALRLKVADDDIQVGNTVVARAGHTIWENEQAALQYLTDLDKVNDPTALAL